MAPEPEDLADFVAERAKKNPKVNRVIQEARLYDSLRENEAWKRLAQRVREDRESYFATIARRLMTGKKVDQREIDYMRGFYMGARWVVEHPEEAEKSLERAARAAWRMVLLEQATASEEESPYIDSNAKEA